MAYQLNFGRVSGRRPGRGLLAGASPFRLAVLGDFSGRANSGQLETGDGLGKRKGIRIDFDNFEDILARFAPTLHLPIAADGGSVEIKPTSIDDLHPDELYENVALFEEMSNIRQRLNNGKTFEKAAAEVHSWLGVEPVKKPGRRKTKARGSTVPAGGKLSDFARLVGRPSGGGDATPADDLIKRIVAPLVVPEEDPDQARMVAAVDQALAVAMRSLLHHPDFQTLESAWRSLDFLVRRIESSMQLQIVVYDVSAEEIAADLSSTDDLQETGLYRMLVEEPALDDAAGALSAVIGLYTFAMTPPHAELLARVAQVSAAAQAPFIAAMSPEVMDVKLADIHPLILQSWSELFQLPEAAYLGLATPRFLLRHPYGAKSDPISAFQFEEFDAHIGLQGMLWANPAVLAGALLAETFAQQGDKMRLGSVMSMGDIPFHYYVDQDGDQVALPSTERMLTERTVAHLAGLRFMPVVSIRGRPEVRLASFVAVGGGELAGRWSDAERLAAATGAEVEEEPAPEDEDTTDEVAEDDALELADTGDDEPEADDIADDDDESNAQLDEVADEEEASDPELDALLAELGGDDEAEAEEEGDGEEMDPELAALLADL